MSEIKTIAQAKESSLNKWNNILNRIKQLRHDTTDPCGFCFYTEYICKNKGIEYECSECIIHEKCGQLVDIESSGAFYQLTTKIDDIISFIENVKEES